MESIGIIRGLKSYTPHQLEQMQKDLALTMSPQRVVYCANYYRTVGRDPLIDELKMLDRYVAAQSRSVSAFAPVSMMTNDEFVAQTYADMMQKRKVLSPNAGFPCTLTEAFGLTTAYLSYAGKPSPYPAFHTLLENKANSHRGDKTHAISTSGSRYGLRLTKLGGTTPAAGDLLLLLLPNAGLPHTKNGCVQKALLEDEQITRQIKSLSTVGEGGLLRSLLELSDGLWIDLTRLSRTGEQLPLTMLADGFVGYDIVRIAASDFESFYRKARTFQVSAMAFAQVVPGTTYTVSRGHLGTFALESGFLRALAPVKKANVTLSNESEYRPAAIYHTPLSEKSCKYLTRTKPSAPEQLRAIGDTVTAVAAATPSSGYFKNAVECALVPILSLAASGCSYTDIRLAVGLSLPSAKGETPEIGSSLSTLLGLYRLLAELGIPLATRRIDTDDAAVDPHLTVFGIGKGAPMASTFSAPSHFIHCIVPTYLDNGLLDFAALRSLLTELVGLNRSGNLVSARVLARESLTDGLTAMSTDRIGLRIEKADSVANGDLPIAIVLETTKKLDAYFVGKTVERCVTKDEASAQRLPQKPFLLANDANEILILSHAGDTDADMLATVLTEQGAHVTHAITVESDTKTLCHAILSAKTMILCGSATLPKIPEVVFAAETFSRAGGWILLPNGAKCGLSLPVVPLQDGLSDSIIDQICKK